MRSEKSWPCPVCSGPGGSTDPSILCGKCDETPYVDLAIEAAEEIRHG